MRGQKQSDGIVLSAQNITFASSNHSISALVVIIIIIIIIQPFSLYIHSYIIIYIIFLFCTLSCQPFLKYYIYYIILVNLLIGFNVYNNAKLNPPQKLKWCTPSFTSHLKKMEGG